MKWIPPAAGLVLGLALCAPAFAQAPDADSLGAGWREQQNEAREAVRQGRLASLAVIIKQIRQRTPGRQLDAGLEQLGDRQVYRIRWMTTDGRRIDYIADAVTGAILSEH